MPWIMFFLAKASMFARPSPVLYPGAAEPSISAERKRL